MNFLNSFKTSLKSISHENFEVQALKLFNYQSKHNKIYQQYIENLSIDPSTVSSLQQIPFLPISFFKNHSIKTTSWQEEVLFESSGTTGTTTSKHYVKDTQHYLTVATHLFENIYGSLTDYHILALLPSYLERGNSSLVFMTNHFIKQTQSDLSGFYLDNLDELANCLAQAYESDKKVLLLGVSFGLLDFIERYTFNMPDLIVMETGGMKGRRKEMIRETLHETLKKGFGVAKIHSEYGMTELLSQAYSHGDGLFGPSSTLKVLIRDVNDPFSYLSTGKTGGVNVIDLANTDSCAFIETQDLGKIHSNGKFEIIGRFDNSDIRGCNLMAL